MRLARTLLTLALFATAIPLLAAPAPTIHLTPISTSPDTDDGAYHFGPLIYGNESFATLLTLAIPRAGNGPFPVIIAVTSDDWTTSPRDTGLADYEVGRGYAVANVSFRPSSTGVFPSQIQDLKTAIRFLRTYAVALNLDPLRFGVWGTSAGGHLAALLATSDGVAALDVPRLPEGLPSARVQAVVDWYGPTDLSKLTPPTSAACPQLLALPLRAAQLVGCPFETTCTDAFQRANPATYANATDTPILVMHGDADCDVPLSSSQAFVDALHAAGVDARLIVVHNAGHGDWPWSSAEVRRQVDEFFDSKLIRGPGRGRGVRH